MPQNKNNLQLNKLISYKNVFLTTLTLSDCDLLQAGSVMRLFKDSCCWRSWDSIPSLSILRD